MYIRYGESERLRVIQEGYEDRGKSRDVHHIGLILKCKEIKEKMRHC